MYNQHDFLTFENKHQFIKKPIPEPRYLKVEGGWYHGEPEFRGLYNQVHNMLEGPCSEQETIKDKSVQKLSTGDAFRVDVEGALMCLDFELERILSCRNGWTVKQGINILAGYGVLSLPESRIAQIGVAVARLERYQELGVLGLTAEEARNTGITEQEYAEITKKEYQSHTVNIPIKTVEQHHQPSLF